MTKNNVKSIREAKNIKVQYMLDKLGMTRQNYWNIENNKTNITQENQEKLCKIFNCSINDLYDENISLNDLKENKRSNMVKLRFFDLSASAGNGCFIDNENFEVMEIDEKQLNEMGIVSNYQNIQVIKAKGNSMFPTIHDKDLLFVDTEKKEIFNNKIYIIREDKLLKVKRVLKKSPLDDEITIKSDNEIDGEYPPYNIKIDGLENVICGMVVFFCRSL